MRPYDTDDPLSPEGRSMRTRKAAARAVRLRRAAGGALFLLAAVWRPGRGPGRFPRAAPWIVFGAVTLGGLIEILQGSVFDGDPELRDWVADVAGAALGFLVWVLAP